LKIHRKNDLNLRLLEIFEAVMRCQTTIDAAEELGISQPAVSTAIKKFEKQVGFNLFDRSGRVMKPTEEARLLLNEVEPVFALLRNIEGEIRDLRSTKSGRLRVAATPPLGHSALPEVLRNFLEERPGVTVRYDIRRLETVLESVETGAVEIGFVLGLEHHRDLEVIQLGESELVCVMPVGHPLCANDAITPADIAKHSFIGLESNIGVTIRRAFHEAGVVHSPRAEVRYCHTACVLANAGIGVGIVDPYSAHFASSLNVELRPFHPKTPITAAAVIRSNANYSRVALEFIEAVKDRLKTTATKKAPAS